MTKSIPHLPAGRKVYFASDFHLGVPNHELSLAREKKIVEWLADVEKDAQAIFLLGDIFDFWFEYKYVVPKGFLRFLGKLADLREKGITIHFFTGNHDMWMFDYFPRELSITISQNPESIDIGGKKFYIGHGDGLGEGDYAYKFLKFFFRSKICQWLFGILPPRISFAFARTWSHSSRSNHRVKEIDSLFEYSKKTEQDDHHDFYIFGHQHNPTQLEVKHDCWYVNLGDWIEHSTYGEFDGEQFQLVDFEQKELVS